MAKRGKYGEKWAREKEWAPTVTVEVEGKVQQQ